MTLIITLTKCHVPVWLNVAVVERFYLLIDRLDPTQHSAPHGKCNTANQSDTAQLLLVHIYLATYTKVRLFKLHSIIQASYALVSVMESPFCKIHSLASNLYAMWNRLEVPSKLPEGIHYLHCPRSTCPPFFFVFFTFSLNATSALSRVLQKIKRPSPRMPSASSAHRKN